MNSYNNYKLTNFSIQCICGREYGFRNLDDIKKCECGREVKIQESLKERLVKEGNAKHLIFVEE